MRLDCASYICLSSIFSAWTGVHDYIVGGSFENNRSIDSIEIRLRATSQRLILLLILYLYIDCVCCTPYMNMHACKHAFGIKWWFDEYMWNVTRNNDNNGLSECLLCAYMVQRMEKKKNKLTATTIRCYCFTNFNDTYSAVQCLASLFCSAISTETFFFSPSIARELYTYMCRLYTKSVNILSANNKIEVHTKQIMDFYWISIENICVYGYVLILHRFHKN